MKNAHRLLVALASLPVAAFAQTTIYLNETFETDTIGLAPADPAQRRNTFATVTAGTGVIGTDNVLNINTTNGSATEYNLDSAALGSLFVQFDLLNTNASPGTGSGTSPIIFGIGSWNSSTSTVLNSNTVRAASIEFAYAGSTSTVKIRQGATTVINSTYSMSALQTVKIFVNDHDTNTLDYTAPSTGSTATLGANSFVVFINDSLVGTETVAGITMGLASTVGTNASLGRIGFNSSSGTTLNFLVDNVFASSVPTPVPEPSSAAALAGLGVLALTARRRRR